MPTCQNKEHLCEVKASIGVAIVSSSMHVSLHIAALRASVQVLLLGFLLVPVLGYPHWWVMLAACAAMLALASAEAASRPRHAYQAR